MRSLRLDPELDEKGTTAAAIKGESVSDFFRRSASERADETGDNYPKRFADVAGVVHGGGGGEFAGVGRPSVSCWLRIRRGRDAHRRRPLIVLIDADEPDHSACLDVLERLALPLVTTWPAFAEAMYLIVKAGGARGHQALWRLVGTGRLEIADLSASAIKRTERLMDQYTGTPMDLADATLVALAEELRQRRIFTLDNDFDVYRLHGRQRFERIPIP